MITKKLFGIFPLLVAVAMVAMPMNLAVAQTTPTGSMQDIPALVEDIVDTLDELFGVVTGAENLNALFRNLGNALTVGFAMLLAGVWQTIYMGIYSGAYGLLCCGVGCLVTAPLGALLAGIYHTLYAVTEFLEALTRPSY